MSKFKKKANVKQEIPTSSMPDVVFMLLFFFMVTTQMRDSSIMVKQKMPQATQLRKLMRKSLVTYISVSLAKPISMVRSLKFRLTMYSSNPRISSSG